MEHPDPITIPRFPLAWAWALDPLAWDLAPGPALSITAGPGTDLFIDPGVAGAPVPVINAPRLVARPAGDFMLSARATVDFRSAFDAAALVIWADDTTWAKLCLERSPQGQAMVVSVVTRGVSDDCNSFVVDASHAWLRISRLGWAWAFHASTDGLRWLFVRHFLLGGRLDPLVGFEAQAPTGDACSVVFDRISFAAERLADLRDGT